MINLVSLALSTLCLLAVPLMANAAESPLIVAHRGLLLHAPENTLVNFRACLELRLGFEFDVGSWFDPKFAGETVPTIDEVLELIAEYQSHDVLIAVDLKAAGVEQEVLRLAERHRVLHKLLFIGRTISEPEVRDRLRSVSTNAHIAVVANTNEEFPKALAATNADYVYFRYQIRQLPMHSSRQNPASRTLF